MPAGTDMFCEVWYVGTCTGFWHNLRKLQAYSIISTAIISTYTSVHVYYITRVCWDYIKILCVTYFQKWNIYFLYIYNTSPKRPLRKPVLSEYRPIYAYVFILPQTIKRSQFTSYKMCPMNIRKIQYMSVHFHCCQKSVKDHAMMS